MFWSSTFNVTNEYEGRVFMRSYADAIDCLKWFSVLFKIMWVEGRSEPSLGVKIQSNPNAY